MASFNKVIMAGNLTRDPELSFLPSQTPVVEFGLATNRKYKGRDGEMKEDVCFVDCRCYGQSAETINKYCSKGSPLLIEGRLTFDRWEAQDGSKRSKHRIFVERFQFLGSGRSSDRSGGVMPSAMDDQADAPVGGDDYGSDSGPKDDIPF